ncbi:hypothetical protein QK292_17345 [Arthrobacter sp. AL08]|uniref:hypothetical protein n=1 Tax=unclassified Arthrobacter TaxID=235627 RepID=UPI001CFFFC59|nr:MULTISPECIES: hypothetical protein [unclassified Arthrobacter]MCB5283725.1 hypothetical protein [Arthrobacter sp. ES1]MDI3243313.1 hypothetical protein [Arthrobacter sp. AL05]MDI3279322.1 hypothetical protein [Arthrobacter sp. AL08]WGZ80897.1 hypothetical protein QI450_06940 [Arthrobacter sp. EM1]
MTALDLVEENGDQSDPETESRLDAAHESYLGSIARMFDAVGTGNTPLALKIDGEEVDPKFVAIAATGP